MNSSSGSSASWEGSSTASRRLPGKRSWRRSPWYKPSSYAKCPSPSRSSADDAVLGSRLLAGIAVVDVAAVAGAGGVGTRDGGESERNDEQGEEGANAGHVTSAKPGCGVNATGQPQPGCGGVQILGRFCGIVGRFCDI